MPGLVLGSGHKPSVTPSLSPPTRAVGPSVAAVASPVDGTVALTGEGQVTVHPNVQIPPGVT